MKQRELTFPGESELAGLPSNRIPPNRDGGARTGEPERDVSASVRDYSALTGRSYPSQQSAKNGLPPSQDYSRLTGRSV
jgi:hypothetical protein